MSTFARLPVERADSRLDSDLVVVEEPLQIRVNGSNLAIILRTPGNDEELAVGFLFTEGIIEDPGQIRSIAAAENQVEVQLNHVIETKDRRFAMTSACGACGKESIDALYAAKCNPVKTVSFRIRAGILHTLPDVLRRQQEIFDQTGGLHAAGLFDAEGHLAIVREDVGRHNAVDKLIGARLLARQPFADSLILVSGRAGFELIQKAGMAGIPMLAAVGAPTTLAVETAKRNNMTLAGFLRGGRFNVYAGVERIVFTASRPPAPDTDVRPIAVPAS